MTVRACSHRHCDRKVALEDDDHHDDDDNDDESLDESWSASNTGDASKIKGAYMCQGFRGPSPTSAADGSTTLKRRQQPY